VHRSEITIDLRALRGNVRRMLQAAAGAELWAVVKADGYGHGAADVGRAALEAGASALCVATVGEATALRDEGLREPRILVLGPTPEDEWPGARAARAELAVSGEAVPPDLPVHLKLDTGMGRFGSVEPPEAPPNAVGVMSHLATADSDLEFAEQQVERFGAAASRYPELTAHLANSAATIELPSARFDAVRCGVALYGLSPGGHDPADDGLEPVLSWRSYLARVVRLEPGQSTGYGRRFVAERPTWIGLVPVGYGDGWRRDLTGTSVLVDGSRCRTIGTVSMDSFAVELPQEASVGTPVTLVGPGLLVEQHARVAGTINYELTCGIESWRARARREVVGA
jgi:alanine racemase